MTDQEMVNGLLAVQGFDHELEAQLHEARLVQITLFERSEETIARAYSIWLDTGHVCIFKAGNSLLEPTTTGLHLGKQALKNYAQRPVTTTIAECAAWQLAKHFGRPWNELFVPCVLKFARLPESGRMEVGAASLFRGGEAGKREFYEVVPEQVSAGAFFDALIGQQDRNKGNVLWYPERRTIYLIDHAFSFARPGDNRGESLLVGWRRQHGDMTLAETELAALEHLLASDDLLTLRRFLEPERAEALAARGRRMIEAQRVVSDF